MNTTPMGGTVRSACRYSMIVLGCQQIKRMQMSAKVGKDDSDLSRISRKTLLDSHAVSRFYSVQASSC